MDTRTQPAAQRTGSRHAKRPRHGACHRRSMEVLSLGQKHTAHTPIQRARRRQNCVVLHVLLLSVSTRRTALARPVSVQRQSTRRGARALLAARVATRVQPTNDVETAHV